MLRASRKAKAPPQCSQRALSAVPEGAVLPDPDGGAVSIRVEGGPQGNQEGRAGRATWPVAQFYAASRQRARLWPSRLWGPIGILGLSEVQAVGLRLSRGRGAGGMVGPSLLRQLPWLAQGTAHPSWATATPAGPGA